MASSSTAAITAPTIIIIIIITWRGTSAVAAEFPDLEQ
jgi:hypothetical protein